MEMQILEDLGLTKNESKVYVSLLKLGSGTVTQIAQDSGIHRVNVYDSLKKLKERHLIVVSENKKEKTIFNPSPPNFLMSIWKEKEIQLQKIIPQLEIEHQLSKQNVSAQVYYGHDFIRNMFIRFLEKKEPIYDLGIPKFVLEQMSSHGMDGKFFQEQIHKRRAGQKQWMYHIYNSDATERIKFLNGLPYTKARCLPKEYDQTVTTIICGDELDYQIFSTTGEKPMIISIRSKEVVDAFKKYFFLIWEKAKVPE